MQRLLLILFITLLTPIGLRADEKPDAAAEQADKVDSADKTAPGKSGDAKMTDVDIELRQRDDSTKAAAAKPQPIETKTVAFLGVSTAGVPIELAAHLKLPEGFGLIVVHVADASPAAAAGLKRHDVIHKFGDQLIVNQQQLRTLVRSRDAGDQVELTVIREGETRTIKAKLIEREVPVERFNGDRLKPVGEFGGDPFRWIEGPGGLRLETPAGVPMFVDRSHSMTRYSDQAHDLTLRHTGDGKQLTIKDKAGNTIFQGPIDTDPQRKLVPQELREKLKKLEDASRVRVERLLPSAGGDIELDTDMLNSLIEQKLQGIQLDNPADHAELQRRIDEMREQIQQMLQQKLQQQNNAAGAGAAMPDAAQSSPPATATYGDGEHQLKITIDGDARTLTVKDKAGTILFDGPIDTDAQREAIPAAVRPKLEMLEQSIQRNVTPTPQRGGDKASD